MVWAKPHKALYYHAFSFGHQISLCGHTEFDSVTIIKTLVEARSCCDDCLLAIARSRAAQANQLR